MYVMRDVMCSGYVAGCNTRFFGTGGKSLNAPVEPRLVKEAIDARLSFHDDAAGEYDSMLAFCAPYGDGAKRDQVISITDRLLPWEVNSSEGKKYFPGGKANFEAAKAAFDLNTIHYGEDIRATENMDYISQARPRALTRGTLL